MAHGGPDYGVGAPKATIYSLQDMAELAVRLGSIVSFDRRGDVIWLDDFEDGIIKWQAFLGGVGSAIASDTTMARNGAKSAKLTTAALADDNVHLTKYMVYPVLSSMGFEISWSTVESTWEIDLMIGIWDGTTAYSGMVEIDQEDGVLRVWGDDGLPHTFGTISYYLTYHMWHTAKVVIDAVAKKYKRFILDSVEYDLSDYAVGGSALVAPKRMTVDALFRTRAAAAKSLYLDDAIVTQNEP